MTLSGVLHSIIFLLSNTNVVSASSRVSFGERIDGWAGRLWTMIPVAGGGSYEFVDNRIRDGGSARMH